MRNTITITTSDKSLWIALYGLKLEGIDLVPQMEHKDAPEGKPVYKVVLAVASSLALNMLANWLYDQVKSQPEGTTKIENQPVAHDRAQITTIIGKYVVINHYHGEEQPDDERVPEESE
jgi:hypothetical protein